MLNNLMKSKLKEIVHNHDILFNEPMKNHTSFKTGGPVSVLLTPRSTEQIKNLLTLFKEDNIPFYIMGNGSNLLVSDEGFSGAIIKIYDNYNHYDIENHTITAQSGILLSKLAKIALSAKLTGFEFASGIPGTLGGAITMNAGAYDGEMKDVLISALVIDKEGSIFEIVNGDLKMGYRTSAIQQNDLIVLSSKISLTHGEYDEIKSKMDDYDHKRKTKQPLEWPSAGSTFKRPAGYYAGKLIQDCGLKGYQLGGAQVSDKHCGFIINKDNASAKDIMNLIKHVQETVSQKFSVHLETEIRQLGKFD
ncbi:MAG: UDP-N-acetylmuramate dehydrogenase [Eubacteriales bacterium]